MFEINSYNYYGKVFIVNNYIYLHTHIHCKISDGITGFFNFFHSGSLQFGVWSIV